MKKTTKSLLSLSLASSLICLSSFSAFALDTSNINPDSSNPHLIQKVAALDGTSDTHQWVTDYDETKQTSYYCYPYAMGITDLGFCPGDTASIGTYKNLLKHDYVSVDEVAELVLDDIESFGASGRILTGTDSNPNYKTSSDEYLIALRVTPQSLYEKGNEDSYNYHFMRRINNNCWRYKAGVGGKVIQLEQGYTPEDVTWDTIKLKSNSTSEYDFVQKNVGFYSSDIIYIVVSQYDEMNISSSSFPTIDIENVYLKNTSVTLGIGACYQIEPIFTPSNASDQDIYWTLPKRYGTIDSSNQLKTRGAGTYTSSGLCNGKKSTVLYFTVNILDILLGDVNLDGEISVQDATLLQSYLAGTTSFSSEDQEFAADVNSDGEVDITDSTSIQKYIAGYYDYFPVEQN